MTRPVVIVDCETTSLVPDYQTGAGVIWELGMIDVERGTEHVWRMEPNILLANEKSLAVGQYAERTAGMRHRRDVDPHDNLIGNVSDGGPTGAPSLWSDPASLARVVGCLLGNATLVAANPTFDAGFLDAFLTAYGWQGPRWHYRLRDIESIAWGWLAGNNGWLHLDDRKYLYPDAGLIDFAVALGINPADYEAHTALGDCRLVKAMLARISGERL